MRAPLRRILYVDDKDSLELIEFLLKNFCRNYEITTVGSSNEALVLINSHRFDLYILDYSLVDLSGVELCCYVRQTDISTPIMFCSAMAHQPAKDRAMKAGANEYLVKPVDINVFMETVEKLLPGNENGLL
jgi:CheY-like chemotaxis protein